MYRIRKRITSDQKLALLLRQPQKTFHTADLALLWHITNKNTLYTTIKRYVQKGILIPIHKGFYSVVPLDTLDPLDLGLSYLHSYGYISTETVLVRAGLILQEMPYITLVGSRSLRFGINDQAYICRQMQETFLYHPVGIKIRGSVRMATVERAVADLLYFNPQYHLDGRDLVDWEKVTVIQQSLGFI